MHIRAEESGGPERLSRVKLRPSEQNYPQPVRNSPHMKISTYVPPSAAIALLTALVLATATVAQAPQGPPPGAGGRGGAPRNYPAPTNLKVLPKNLTGAQVHDIMRTWAGSLGVGCDECHTPDPVKKNADGKPVLNFADDSQPDKRMARIMYTMTEDLKVKYIAKVAAMDPMTEKAAPLTCGTCHRGHEDPEKFEIPKENREGGH
jgi:hypothetical protein